MATEAAALDIAAAAGRAAASAASGSGSGISFDGVQVAYRSAVALEGLSLTIAPGGITAIIGPSGCGKTTALRVVAGFVRPTAGRVLIGESDVTDLPPYARDIGMVVQNYALFPHMRVDANVGFGLRARRMPAEPLRQRVAECLRLVGMADYARRFPRELSGGQQQRVAIARALAIRPRVLLLDEPLSALDAQIRRTMLDELARLHRELPHLTILFVTHDQAEALALAEHIAIMRAGRLVAHGPSLLLYQEPPNRFAAEFLGRANLLAVEVERVEQGLAAVRLGAARLKARAPHGITTRGRSLLCVRPHAFAFESDGRENSLEARVTDVSWLGDRHSIELMISNSTIHMSVPPMRTPPMTGSDLAIHFFVDDTTLVADDVNV